MNSVLLGLLLGIINVFVLGENCCPMVTFGSCPGISLQDLPSNLDGTRVGGRDWCCAYGCETSL